LYVAATLNQNSDSRKQKYVPDPRVALETLQICRIRSRATSIRRTGPWRAIAKRNLPRCF